MSLFRHWIASYVVVIAIWGSCFALTTVALSGFEPSVVAFGRIVIGAAALAIFMFVGKTFKFGNLSRRDVGWMLLLGSCTVVGFVAVAFAQTRINSGLTAIVCASTPLLAAALSRLARVGQQVSGVGIVGLLVGVAGVGLLVGAGTLSGGFDVVGIAAALVGAASFALSTVMAAARFAKSPYTGTQLTFMQFTAAGLLLLLALPMCTVPVELPGAACFALLLLGVLGGAVANVLYWRVMRLAGPVTASTTFQSVPIVATILGVVVLGEVVTLTEVAGGALIILGLVALCVRRRPAVAIPQPRSAVSVPTSIGNPRTATPVGV